MAKRKRDDDPKAQVVGFDVTIPKNKYREWRELGKQLNEWCKKWVFQEEKGEGGYEHWQVRLHLIQKKTHAGMISDLKMGQGPISDIGGHWSVTSGGVHLNNKFNYVMKKDSRVDGPWKDSDYQEPAVMTRQLRYFLENDMYPWQTEVMGWCQEPDDRKVDLILDRVGNSGKSILAEYLEYHGLAFEMPPLRQMEDIMQFAYSFPVQKAYLIDMPRAMKKDRLGDFYAGLESIKNGVCYDKRYCGKKRRFDRPRVIVFSNCAPDWKFLSADRWNVYDMLPDKSLNQLDVASMAGDTPETPGGSSGAAL